MLVHGDDLGGCLRGAAGVRRRERLDDVGGAYQHHLEVLVLFKRQGDAFEHDGRRVVSAHGIDGHDNMFGIRHFVPFHLKDRTH